MKDINIKVTCHEELRGITVDLFVGRHCFSLDSYSSKEEANQVATEVRALLGLKTAPAELTMTEVELAKANEFTLEHQCARVGTHDFSVRYAASGVGTRKVLTCIGCGKELDVTDYDSW